MRCLQSVFQWDVRSKALVEVWTQTLMPFFDLLIAIKAELQTQVKTNVKSLKRDWVY